MNFQELAENLGLEVDEYGELIELFISTGAADLDNIEQGLTGQDMDMVIRSAHTIKGASGNLGLMDVSMSAKIIEDNAGKNKLDEIGRALQTLKTQFATLKAFAENNL